MVSVQIARLSKFNCTTALELFHHYQFYEKEGGGGKSVSHAGGGGGGSKKGFGRVFMW